MSIELKKRIINKDKEGINYYFDNTKHIIRTNREVSPKFRVIMLMFVEQVQKYILEEAD